MEFPQREILNVITAAGITPDNGDLSQLLEAIQFLIANRPGTPGLVHYGQASGTNALTATFAPSVASLAPGQIFLVKIQNNNTGAVTLNPDGNGFVPVVRQNQGALQANDLVANELALLVLDNETSTGTQFELVSTMPGGSVSEAAYVHYGVDTGAANAMAATMSPAISGVTDGELFLVKVGNDNTGDTTFNPSGLGASQVTNPNGSALAGGTLVAGSIAILVRSGTKYQFLGSLPNGGFSASLVQNGWVRFPNGFQIVWGKYTGNLACQQAMSLTWPLAFTTGVFTCVTVPTYRGPPPTNGTITVEPQTLDLANPTFYVRNHVERSDTLVGGFWYIAIGK